MSRPPKNVLLLSLSGIGNFLMQSPVFAALKKSQPDWELTVWVAPRGTCALAEANPHIDYVIEQSDKRSPLGHFSHVLALSRSKYDIGIVLYPGQHWKSAGYLYLAGIAKRIGHTYPFRGNKSSGFLLTDAIFKQPKLHDIEQNLRLVQPLGITSDKLTATNYQLTISEKNQQQAQKILRGIKISKGQPIIGLHPGSASHFIWKRWPLDNFAAVGQQLIHPHNAHLLILGGSKENKLKETLKAKLGANASIISTDLLTTAAIMQHCQLILANDSGLMHLAAASDAPVLGLFGPTNENQVGPRGANTHTMRASGTKPSYDTVTNYNLGSQPHPSLLALKPGGVVDKIVRIVGL